MLTALELKQRIMKENQLSILEQDIEGMYQQYIKGTQYQFEAYHNQIQDFNTQLAFIDGLRQTYIMPLLNQLFLLLTNVGSPSKKPSTVISLTDHQTQDKLEQKEVTFVYESTMKKLKEMHESNDNVIVKTIHDIKLNLKKIEDGKKAKTKLRRVINDNQEALNTAMKQMETNLTLAKLYRDIIVMIKESLEQVVLPELTAVRAFLIAENVKNSLNNKEKEFQPVPESVILIANSNYQKHYLFVKSVFGYYTTLIDLCETPILSAFEHEKELTQKEIKHFMEQKDRLNQQYRQLQENILISKS